MRWRRFIRYAIALAICLVLLILGVGRVTNVITDVLQKDLTTQLTETTGSKKDFIQQRTNSDFQELERLAAAVGALGGPKTQEAVDFILREEWKVQNARITISDAAGNSRSNDGLSKNIGDEEIFKKAMAGEPSISDVRAAMMNSEEEKTIILMVPIYNGTEVLGTLALSRDASYYRNVLNFSLFQKVGNGYIVRPDGTVILWNENEGTPLDLSGDKEGKLLQEMAAGNAGDMELAAADGSVYYLSYTPLAINDWYLVSEINANAINEQKEILRKVATSVAVIAIVLFVILLVALFISDERKSRLMERMAMFDQLTGLHNWQYMQNEFKGLTAHGEWIYMLLRIKEFTRISTVFGYSVAARLLRDVAASLKHFAGEKELCVHVSEDYFAVLFKNQGGKEAVEKRISGLLTEMETVTLTEGNVIYDYHCTYAGGICPIKAEDKDFTVISRRVNSIIAGQLGKKGSSWAWYEPEVNDHISMQEILMPDIVRALQNEEFIPFFHPQYNVETGEITGAEVLARWQHPQHGILLPGVFVPLLEASGCVLELDMIMLDQACKMIKGWLSKGLYPVPLCVNISRLNIHRRDFMERIQSIIKQYNIPASLIALEATEAAVSENSEKALALARQIKAEGFILSMDDFGSGYSSLNMMREIPVDIVKLSRKFLMQFQNGERSEIILRHLVDMVHELNAEIVADGIETAEQEAVIRATGCNMVMGFYYSRPVAAEEFETLVFPETEE